MMEEPVAKASENSTKPNSAVAQSVRSALSRERCIPRMAAWARNSRMKSRSATASMLFGLGAANPRSRASASRSMGKALPVARQHEHVRQQVMGEQDRLSALQVRIPGHPAVQVLFRASEQRSLDVGDAVIHVAEDVAEIEPLVQRDLVVAGAARMELAAHRARQLDEPPLDVHVDVFELLPEGERAAFELGADGLQPREH